MSTLHVSTTIYTSTFILYINLLNCQVVMFEICWNISTPGQLTYFCNLVNHSYMIHIMKADVLTIFLLLGQGWTRTRHFKIAFLWAANGWKYSSQKPVIFSLWNGSNKFIFFRFLWFVWHNHTLWFCNLSAPVRHPSRTQQETLCLVYIGDIGNRIVIVSGPGMSFTQMVAPSITPESLGSDTGL